MKLLNNLFLLVFLFCSVCAQSQTAKLRFDASILMGTDDETELSKPFNKTSFKKKNLPRFSEVQILKVQEGNHHEMIYVQCGKKTGWIHRYTLEDRSILFDFIPDIRSEFKQPIINGNIQLGMNIDEALLAADVPGIEIKVAKKDGFASYRSMLQQSDPQYWEISTYKDIVYSFRTGALFSEIRKKYEPIYNWVLVDVYKPDDAPLKASEINTIETQDGINKKYSYEDDNMYIIWMIGSKTINFDIKNKSNYSIKIPWDEAAYVDDSGETGRVIHSGIKYSEKNSEQPPSVVPRNATLSDLLIPADNIFFSKLGKVWLEHPLVEHYLCPQEMKDKFVPGKKIKVILPLVIKDVVNEYTFTFELQNVFFL